MPVSACLGALVATTLVHYGIAGEPAREMTTVFTFDNESDAGVWPATNDGVMGGLSEGRSAITRAAAGCAGGRA